MKCEVLGKVHSLPISEIDFEVEINSRRECISRWRMNRFVGRHLEVAPELLLERGERAVCQPGQLLDRDVLEDVVVDDLLEVLLGGIDVAQQLALDAAVLVRGDQVDQFGHLDVLGLSSWRNSSSRR